MTVVFCHTHVFQSGIHGEQAVSIDKKIVNNRSMDMSRAHNNASLIQEYRFNEYLSLMTDKGRVQHHASSVYDLLVN
jgi:hypothetical protein